MTPLTNSQSSRPTRGSAADWDHRYATSSPWPSGPNVTVHEVASDLPAGRALDIACGDGRHALWLAGLGWHVRAVDFSAVAIERAKQIAAQAAEPGALPGTIEWQVADVTAHTPAPESADLVLLIYLHLAPEQAAAALDLAATAVAPGGRLLLVGHDRSNLTDGVGGPRNPAVLTDPDSVASSLTAAGLVVERAEVVSRHVPEADRNALDTVVLARRPT